MRIEQKIQASLLFCFWAVASLAENNRVEATELYQTNEPKPLWTIEQKLAVGEPLVSPNGKWLVIMRSGDWYRQGEWLMVVDLVARKVVQNQALSPVGIIGIPSFDPSLDLIRAVVNTTGGCALATWTIPDLKISVSDIGFGRAVTATLSHKQDKAVIMREDGVIGVFDVVSARKLLEVDFHRSEKKIEGTQSIAITWDDKIVTSGVLDHRLCSWRMEDGSRLETRSEREAYWGYPVEYTFDNSELIIPAWHFFLISDAQDGKPLFRHDANGLRSLSYDSSRNLAAVPIGDGTTIGVVDAANGQLVMSARHEHGSPTTSGEASWACLAPDGQVVYSGGFFSIKAWDLAGALAKYNATTPKTQWVNSWQGHFKITSPAIRITIDGLPPVDMWKYELSSGSPGTIVGFSNESGSMMYQPLPDNKGVQPVYQTHVVLQDKDKTAHIVIAYEVQGNAGGRIVESFRYDGETISKEATSLYGGRPESKWRRDDSVQTRPARRAGPP